MCRICFVKIFDMDLESFGDKSVYLVFFDNLPRYLQGDTEDITDFVNSPIGFDHRAHTRNKSDKV